MGCHPDRFGGSGRARLAAGIVCLLAALPCGAAKPVVVLTVEGIIDPVIVRYIQRGHTEAETIGAQCVVLKINTPGGLEISMRKIVEVILNSPVPTIAYVEPKGGRAASAGAFIVMASHLAAMSPGTTLGAAHPVAIGVKEVAGGAVDDKVTNDAAALMRSLAQQRGRDATWAEESVIKSVSVNEREALEKKIVDCIAEDLGGVLKQLDGRKIAIGGKDQAMDFQGAPLTIIDASWRERLFHVLAHPEIAYILLMLGTMALIFEFKTPGFGVGGFIGAVCLILALISLSILPFNAGGLALLALAVGLFLAEIKLATHGALGALGVLSLILGSLMLFSPIEPFWRLSRAVIAVMVAMSGGFFLLIAWIGLSTLRKGPSSGREILVGAEGVAVTALDPKGIVHIMGEDWSAYPAGGSGKIGAGEHVTVKSVKGLKLEVESARTEQGNKEP